MAECRFIIVMVVAAFLKGTHSVTNDEQTMMKETLEPILAACGKEHDVSGDALKNAKEEKTIDGINNCFMACVVKATKLFNDEGKLDVESATQKVKDFFSSTEDQDHIIGILKTCSSVNNEEVKDGKEGCDRARLFALCLIDQKYEFLG